MDEQRRDEFAGRVMSTSLAAMEALSIYIGERLGLYGALADGYAVTPSELAARAGIHERYAREWLEQQAVAGILDVAEHSTDHSARRYRLAAEHAHVLADHDSLYYLSPLVRLVTSATGALPRLLEAYRGGHGVDWSEYGADAREGQAAINRPAFLQLVGSEWFPAVPDVHARLQSDPPARVADIGCGAGWSSIGIARAYPLARVDGYDLDAASVELATENAHAAGLGDRVRFHLRDASDAALAGRYDLVTIFEALHDMSRPVEALSTVRRLLTEGGAAIVVDERVAEEFTAPGDDIERMMYGWSILICLANGLTDQPSAATGTVMRPSLLREYAQQAGFADIEVLPIENDFFRFYRLVT
jgi:2-polyprenyl-3-methyl-5-hydroxy-6-metoxy-1,4-benzoquinol methylase